MRARTRVRVVGVASASSSVIRVTHPSHPSESPIRVIYPSHLSESPIRVTPRVTPRVIYPSHLLWSVWRGAVTYPDQAPRRPPPPLRLGKIIRASARPRVCVCGGGGEAKLSELGRPSSGTAVCVCVLGGRGGVTRAPARPCVLPLPRMGDSDGPARSHPPAPPARPPVRITFPSHSFPSHSFPSHSFRVPHIRVSFPSRTYI